VTKITYAAISARQHVPDQQTFVTHIGDCNHHGACPLRSTISVGKILSGIIPASSGAASVSSVRKTITEAQA
jgi:hypothetical protein